MTRSVASLILPSHHLQKLIRRGQRLAFSLFLTALLVAALSPTARAQDLGSSTQESSTRFDDGWKPEKLRAYSPFFQGMFTEVGARYGRLSLPQTASFEADTFGAHLRFAFPMSVGDLRLAYNLQRITPTQRAHLLGLHLAIHPLYLLMLGSDWISYVLGAIYVDAGLGPQYTRLLDSPDSSSTSLMLSLGAGVDIPLFSTRHGQAPWLNLSYQRQSARYPLDNDRACSHQLHVGLAWRWNRLPF